MEATNQLYQLISKREWEQLNTYKKDAISDYPDEDTLKDQTEDAANKSESNKNKSAESQ